MKWSSYKLTAEEYCCAMYQCYLKERRKRLLLISFIISLLTLVALPFWLLFFILEHFMAEGLLKSWYRKRYEQDKKLAGPFLLAFDEDYIYFRYLEQQLRCPFVKIGTIVSTKELLIFRLEERGLVILPFQIIDEDDELKESLMTEARFAAELKRWEK